MEEMYVPSCEECQPQTNYRRNKPAHDMVELTQEVNEAHEKEGYSRLEKHGQKCLEIEDVPPAQVDISVVADTDVLGIVIEVSLQVRSQVLFDKHP